MAFKPYKRFILFLYKFCKLIFFTCFSYWLISVFTNKEIFIKILIIFSSLVMFSDILQCFLTKYIITNEKLIIKSHPYPIYIRPLKIEFKDIIKCSDKHEDGFFEIIEDFTIHSKNVVYVTYKHYNEEKTSYKIKKYSFSVKDKERFVEIINRHMINQ